MAYRLSQAQFDEAKRLFRQGASYDQASKTVGLSTSTLSLIKRSSSLEDYRRLYSILWQKQKKKIAERRSNSRIQPTARLQPDTGLLEVNTGNEWKVDIKKQLEFWTNASIKDSETKEDYFPREIIINGKTYGLVEDRQIEDKQTSKEEKLISKLRENIRWLEEKYQASVKRANRLQLENITLKRQLSNSKEKN
jgi:hypothetical protein